MAGPCRPVAASPGEFQVTHDDEASPDNEFKKEDEVVERPKGLKHGYSIVRKPVNGDVSRLLKQA